MLLLTEMESVVQEVPETQLQEEHEENARINYSRRH